MRLSVTDWAEGPEKDADGKWLQWGIEQTILLAGEPKKLGVDLVDVSSRGNWAPQKIPVVLGYQVRPALPLSISLSGNKGATVACMACAPSLSLFVLVGPVCGGGQEGTT